MKTAESVIAATKRLRAEVDRLTFALPVTHVYNPLNYAWKAHEAYLKKYATTQKKVIFLGMNPGPWGMAQVGVPFGEVSLVRDWVKINESVEKPSNEHPKRPIQGFDCQRSEVSGRRLWSLFKDRFGTAEAFFKDHFVANYCPLVFMEETGRNRTPDKLSKEETNALYEACDVYLREIVDVLKPEWVIGVGAFAENRIKIALEGRGVKIGKILHPSPASPAANRGWAELATKQMVELGIWKA